MASKRSFAPDIQSMKWRSNLKRHGDAVCDYLYGLYYKLGIDRGTQIRMSRTVGAAASTAACAVTVLNLTCEDGESNGNVPMNVTFAMNGKPWWAARRLRSD